MNRQLSVALRCAILCGVSGCSWGERSQFDQASRGANVRVDTAAIAGAKLAPEPTIHPETHFRSARFQESAGRLDKAIEQYKAAIAADPEYADAYDRLGVLLGFTGHHAEAVAALRKGIALAPNNPQIRNNLGFEFIVQERWAEAEGEFRRAIAISPKFDRSHINLGVALAFQHRYDEALRSFREVLPEPDAQYNLGLSYRMQDRRDEARTIFERILAKYPDFEAARVQLETLGRVRGEIEAKDATRVVTASAPVVGGETEAIAEVAVVSVQSVTRPEDVAETGGVTKAEAAGAETGDARVDGDDTESIAAVDGPAADAETTDTDEVEADTIDTEVAAREVETGGVDGTVVEREEVSPDRDGMMVDAGSVVENAEERSLVADRGSPTASGASPVVPVEPAFSGQELPASPAPRDYEPITPVVSTVDSGWVDALLVQAAREASPARVALPEFVGLRGDFDSDGDVDLTDFARLQSCISRGSGPTSAVCAAGDFDNDGDVDIQDYISFRSAVSQP